MPNSWVLSCPGRAYLAYRAKLYDLTVLTMLQHETHNAQSRTHLGKTLPSQDSRHTEAHYDVDTYDVQVRLISRDAEVYQKNARIWGRHYQAKIQDMQTRATTSTCMMLKSGLLVETP